MALAPTQLGGAVTYVIVDGNSMEPRFRFGDLVLVRTESAYGAGDAVVYRNAEMGRYVFHRIVGTELSQYILKGDNNSWLDSYQPVQDEIIGKLWVHIPKAGKVVEWVRLPINMALTVALLGGVLMSGMFDKPTKNESGKKTPPKIFGGMQEGALYLFVFLALAFLGLTIFSFTRPLTRSSANIPYQQEGIYFYSATGTPGVYDSELVRSGEPVFPKLTCFLNVGFTYNLMADHLQGVSGSHQMYARVMDAQSGWQRTIPLNPQTGFSGNTYFSMATLDLCEVESLVTLVEQETGLHPNAYTLEVVADAAVAGVIAGRPMNDTFAAALVFNFDKVHFYLASDDPQADSLRSVKQGLAGSANAQVNTFSILGLNPSVRSIRVMAILGFGFSLMGLFSIGMRLYRTAQQSQDALIRLKYGGMLVEVFEQNLAPASSIVDVTTMDNLAKLAERHGAMILHMSRNFLHYYLVQASGITYRYVITVGKRGSVENEFIKAESLREADDLLDVEPGPLQSESSQNLTSDIESVEYVSNNNDEIISADSEAGLVWKKIQNEAQEYLASHTENRTSDDDLAYPEPPQYVIQTGEIGYYSTEPVETLILRKIKL